jgi:Skp family chaperone for outer membrane proteins
MFVAVVAILPAYAQQRQPAKPAATPAVPAQTGGTTAIPAKIAFVNTDAFRVDKTGINRWVAAAKSVEREFEPLQRELLGIVNRIQAINKDLETLSKSAVVDDKSISAKQEESARLQREHKFKKDEGEARLKKRYEDVVGPVSADIGKALDTFAKQRGITLLLDTSRMIQSGAILSADSSTDMTAAFIAEYNSKNPATASVATPGR